MTTYVLAGGCFWCLEAVFRELRGVKESLCVYAGGTEADANYYAVASGATDHAEAVKVTFDESVLPRDVLLDIYFAIHDPTSLNRQGADAGPQYRSAMFYADDEQQKEFEAAIDRASSEQDKPIVTVLSPLEKSYVAEPEHQDYYNQNPFSGYCSFVISPKVQKTRKEYSKYLNA
jgi:peptide-methionine (S)-S-oxide reductase